MCFCVISIGMGRVFVQMFYHIYAFLVYLHVYTTHITFKKLLCFITERYCESSTDLSIMVSLMIHCEYINFKRLTMEHLG